LLWVPASKNDRLPPISRSEYRGWLNFRVGTRHSLLTTPTPPHMPQVCAIRTRNSMRPFNFSPGHAPGFLLSVRDKFGRDRQSGGTPKKLLSFFGFLPRCQCDSVTHNPLVPGSSPGGPTISHRIHHALGRRTARRLNYCFFSCEL
jgi:hypothetical protein